MQLLARPVRSGLEVDPASFEAIFEELKGRNECKNAPNVIPTDFSYLVVPGMTQKSCQPVKPAEILPTLRGSQGPPRNDMTNI